jgi:L(+)-tartrate dehydratase beta subunit
MPECLWRIRVRGLGPLIVGMDAHGGDLYADVLAEAKRRVAAMFGGPPSRP